MNEFHSISRSYLQSQRFNIISKRKRWTSITYKHSIEYQSAKSVYSFCSFKFFWSINALFLGATKHLYNWLCPSVGQSVGLSGNAFARRSTCCTLLAYMALFYCSFFSNAHFSFFRSCSSSWCSFYLLADAKFFTRELIRKPILRFPFLQQNEQ